MAFNRLFVPADPAVAKKLIAVLTGVASAVSIVLDIFVPLKLTMVEAAVAIGGPVFVLAVAVAILVMPEPTPAMWAAYPLGATVILCATNLVSNDASLTAQLFFFFPVLYGGAQLTRRAAVILCAAAVAGHFVTVVAVLPTELVLVDVLVMTAALATATGILVYTSERVAMLVAQLRDQAAIDPLTGLVTRRVLDGAVDTSLRSAASDGGTALILIDIDHFKQINDEHGHPAGDLVLQRVADLLMSCSRRSDVTSRMGGDELAMLLPGCTLAHALDRAERLMAEVRSLRIDLRPVSMSAAVSLGELTSLTVSIGIAHLPTHACDVHDLYRAADISLYRAKRAGRDRIGQLTLEAS